jgi:hypothetical protein
MSRTIKISDEHLVSDRISQLVEDQSQSDRRFFDNNPSRAHLIRLAHPAEIADEEYIIGQEVPIPAGSTCYAAVRRVPPGRLRLLFVGPSGFPAGHLSEEQAAYVYESVATRLGGYAELAEAIMRQGVE